MGGAKVVSTNILIQRYRLQKWCLDWELILLGVVYLLVSPMWWMSHGYMQEGVRIEMVVLEQF